MIHFLMKKIIMLFDFLVFFITCLLCIMYLFQLSWMCRECACSLHCDIFNIMKQCVVTAPNWGTLFWARMALGTFWASMTFLLPLFTISHFEWLKNNNIYLLYRNFWKLTFFRILHPHPLKCWCWCRHW